MVYKESPAATIFWDQADGIATIEWRAYADGADYRNILSALVDLMEQKSASRLLVDNRRSKVVTPEDQAWVNTVWSPAANKAGLRYTAMLVPQSTVAKLSLDRMRSKYTPPKGGGTMTFTDIEEAREWLRAAPR